MKLDAERGLMLALDGLVEASAAHEALSPTPRWRPGGALKLLLVGYVGVRNTGADARVIEIARQIRAIFGDDLVHLGVSTVDPELSAGYFPACRPLTMPVVYPKFLYDEAARHHGVIACEGSMFKSKFSNALTLLMAGVLGLAGARGKMAVAYGGEAGKMDPALARMVAEHARSALVVCRNEASRDVLRGLGLRTELGTDTAWTFDPSPREAARALLRDAGVDLDRKLLVVCPVDPYAWPVRPNLAKAAALGLGGLFARDHYRSIYFHERPSDANKRYDAYLGALAKSVATFARERGYTVAIVGMERLDRRACEDLANRLWPKPPVLVSDQYDAYDLVAILRCAALLVSSRYHAIVTSMPALVPSVGVSIDERIENLMVERGDDALCFDAGAEHLSDRIVLGLRRIEDERDAAVDRIGKSVVLHLSRMARMGRLLEDEVVRIHPEFPRRARSWQGYLPPLTEELRRLVEQHGVSS